MKRESIIDKSEKERQNSLVCKRCVSKQFEGLYWKDFLVFFDIFAVPLDCPLRVEDETRFRWELESLSDYDVSRIAGDVWVGHYKTTISKDELKEAMKGEKISHRLSRLMCFHQSEWWVDSEMKYWESVFKMIGSKQAELQKEVFRNIYWWDEVSRKFKNLLPTPSVYQWHPIAFVENMREMNREPE